MRAVIFAGGPAPPPEFCRGHLEPGDLVVCADGGWALARQAGATPAAVVGDLDSLSPDQVDLLEASRIEVLRYPEAKDASDLELALVEAKRRGAREAVVLGAIRGRFDHALFNAVALLSRARELRMRVRLVDPGAEIFLVEPEHPIEGRVGWTASLLPLSRQVTGVMLEGFEYELAGETLRRASTRGLSNRVRRSPARIRYRRGDLLAVLTPP